MRVRAFLTALGLNAVPAFGWFVGEWSAGTTLLLYWLETLIGTLLVAARIILHRRARPSKGHWDYRAPQGQNASSSKRSTFLSAFLVPAVAFSLFHGVFLGVLGFMMISKNHSPEARIETDALLAGLLGVAVFQLADFVFDLFWLRTQPFVWVERLGNLSISRVLVIHLTIIGGMAAVMLTGANRNFFGVFIVLKTLLNLSLVVPQYQPKTPPRWLSSLMDRVPGKKLKDASFAEFWMRTDREEAARVARNEERIIEAGS
jgi:hypothetical protein